MIELVLSVIIGFGTPDQATVAENVSDKTFSIMLECYNFVEVVAKTSGLPYDRQENTFYIRDELSQGVITATCVERKNG